MTNITVSPSWWQLFLGGIKSIFGGQIQSYDKVLRYGRAEVMQRLREQALGEGWSEIINVRVETSMVMNKVKGASKTKWEPSNSLHMAPESGDFSNIHRESFRT